MQQEQHYGSKAGCVVLLVSLLLLLPLPLLAST
jgi:hypothetical protein